MGSVDIFTLHNIKLNELETAFLNAQVVAPFCVSWSKDNKISIVVEGGVFIYELWPSPLCDQQKISFFKSWIPADTLTPLSRIVDNENGSFLWNLGRKQAYEACIDSTLSYAVQKLNSSFGSSQIIQCEFSPLIGCKSYISCLTNHGLLQIYKNSLKKWTPITNVTQLWISHCTVKNDQKQMDFLYFKSEMLKLKITTMKWVDEPEIIFITGHENGELVLWNVEIVNEKFGMTVKQSYKNIEKPNYIFLSNVPNLEMSFLFIGTLSGILKCMPLDLNSGMSNEEFFLWNDKDLMAPNVILTKCVYDKLLVFSVKRHILLIQILSVNEANQLELLETQWEEFDASISSWNECNDSFILSLQNHDVYMMACKCIDTKVVYEKIFIDMGVKRKHKNSHYCYGMALSQNNAIWMLVSSPKQNYDSIKEITHLILYAPEIKKFKSLTGYTSGEVIDQILNKYKCTQLNEIFDLLELKKLELLSDVSKFRKNYDVTGDLTLLHLQLMLWEVKLKLFCNLFQVDSLVSDLEFSITRTRAKKIICNLRKCSSLSLLEKKSLNVCEVFLMNVREKAKSLNEVCCICGCESFCYNIRISSCPNLHKFPRCCLSLLPCEKVPYAVCWICESVAITDFVLGSDNRCPYCDGLLVLDTRFRSSI